MAETKANKFRPTLAQAWQLPVLLLGVALFGYGLYLAAPSQPEHPYADALQKVQAMVAGGQYPEALAALDQMAPLMSQMPEALRGQYELLSADTLYLAQKSKHWNKPSNNQQIVDWYHKAMKLGQKLDDTQYDRLVDSLVGMGKIEDAMAVLNTRGDAGAEARQKLLRQLIREQLDRKPVDVAATQKLIDQLLAEPKLPPKDEVWAIARQGELMMNHGQTHEAVDMLLRRIARLESENVDHLGELFVQLGLAYLGDGDPVNAERWLMRARQTLAEADPLNGKVLVGLGQIRFAEDNVVEASEFFTDAVNRFGTTSSYLPALIGKAECESRLGSPQQSLDDYTKAVNKVDAAATIDPEQKKHLIDSLTTQYELRFGQGDYELSLKFLDLAKQLYKEPLPPDVMLKLAMTHEQVARQMLGLKAGETESPADWEKLDKEHRLAVAKQYAAAADAYLSHARAVTITDNDAYGRSLWKAGEYYDKAGMHKQAIAVFSEYVKARPNDPKQLAAMFRLAQAQQADGQYDQAVALYKKLIEEHPKSPEAYGSLVPLARCYIAMGPKHTSEAEQVLLSVVTDNPALRPESNEYREALIELGQLYYRRGGEGDYEKAIARLDEVVQRYGDDDKAAMPALTYQLGDAYRKSVQQIDEKLGASLPPSQAAALRTERARRLDRAQQAFDSVIAAYEKRSPQSLNELQQLYLRNSYFYRADCAYDLGRYEGPDGAIALYEKAVQRYDKDPAALVALVQMVNSYCELGQFDKARAVNERAKVFLRRIPESAFDDPNLPMSRKHWQRWLDWTSQLAVSSAAPPK